MLESSFFTNVIPFGSSQRVRKVIHVVVMHHPAQRAHDLMITLASSSQVTPNYWSIPPPAVLTSSRPRLRCTSSTRTDSLSQHPIATNTGDSQLLGQASPTWSAARRPARHPSQHLPSPTSCANVQGRPRRRDRRHPQGGSSRIRAPRSRRQSHLRQGRSTDMESPSPPRHRLPSASCSSTCSCG